MKRKQLSLKHFYDIIITYILNSLNNSIISLTIYTSFLASFNAHLFNIKLLLLQLKIMKLFSISLGKVKVL
jgi:hypothetical protein